MLICFLHVIKKSIYARASFGPQNKLKQIELKYNEKGSFMMYLKLFFPQIDTRNATF